MPLPQQDEFGVIKESYEPFYDGQSQCRFRSKMNSETIADLTKMKNQVSQCRFRSKMNSEKEIETKLNKHSVDGLNAASAAR